MAERRDRRLSQGDGWAAS